MSIVPPHAPGMIYRKALDLLRDHDVTAKVSLLGVRGYYLNSLGEPLKNDRGLYDDAIFVIGQGIFRSFNANTDPTPVYKEGTASLRPGLWYYEKGIHNLSKDPLKRYAALVQALPVTIERDGGKCETGFFGINIHRGGYWKTGSLGCQTIYPDQWEDFIQLVSRSLKDADQRRIPYLLVENDGTIA